MVGQEITRDKYGRPRLFIEDECPVEELSIECQREGSAALHPPHSRIHVWWARRPLTVSRAAVLGSLLPAGFDRKEFLEIIGVPKEKDPIAAQKKIMEVRTGIRNERVKDPYGYPRGFTHNLTDLESKTVRSNMKSIWGTGRPSVLDSFSGGGSIPFECVRLGLIVTANELNPVASIIERATIEYPLLYGEKLASDLKKIGLIIEHLVTNEVSRCFPRNPGEMDLCYIWVRTIQCGLCGLYIPLAPNWWLSDEEDLGFQLQVPEMTEDAHCSFKVVKASVAFDPEKGTIKGGIATCPNPRCQNVIEGVRIKDLAKDGKMEHQLAVIGFKMQGRSGRFFREVTQVDLDGVMRAEEKLKERLPYWERKGLVPDEEIPFGKETARLHEVGISHWRQMFNPRQLLVHLTTLEKISDYSWSEIKDTKMREALRIYFQIVFDKCIDWNSTGTTWHPNRIVLGHTFQRHDFAPKWSYGEIDGAGNLFRFGNSQIVSAYKELAGLALGSQGKATFITGDASKIDTIKDRSIDLVCIDPPYYDNVMYSECSDFFYVWMKRGIGDLFPELFSSILTDKDREAVANVSRFKNSHTSARELASKDYEAKMKSSFNEIHRVLRDDGAVTIMFTHKKVEAWDTLAMALLDAGFMITAAWPVHTESEHSLHQAKKNAASSTILLVCRKRPSGAPTAWWEDLQLALDEKVREKARDFASRGLRGQDTFIACFGPALQIISEAWPVKKKDGTTIRPDEALDRARTVVSAWFLEKIAEGKAETLDPTTRFYIMSWFLFQAREFPFDEARKLGISLNVEVEDLIRRKMLEKKGEYVKFMKPTDRARVKGLDPSVKSFDTVIDLVQAAMCSYEAGQSMELTRFHQRTGALANKGYHETIEYLLEVLPRTKEVQEYDTLDRMWESNYRDSVKRKIRNTDPTGNKQTKLAVDDFRENQEGSVQTIDSEELKESKGSNEKHNLPADIDDLSPEAWVPTYLGGHMKLPDVPETVRKEWKKLDEETQKELEALRKHRNADNRPRKKDESP